MADKILSSWMLIIAILMIRGLIGRYFPNLPSRYFVTNGAMLLLFGPGLYLYAKYLVSGITKFHRTDYLHLIPFFVILILDIFMGDISIKADNQTPSSQIFWRIFAITFILTLPNYNLKVYLLIRQHRKRVQNMYSFKSDRLSLAWLSWINIIFTLSFLSLIILWFLKVNISPITGVFLGFTLLAYSVSFFGFHQPDFFHRSNNSLDLLSPNHQEEDESEKPQPRYERSGLKDPDARRYQHQLMAYMETHKPFLKGELTLQEVSDAIDIPKHYLTQIINERLNKNFYTFINEYRVEAVKEKIKEGEADKITILAIAFECGFNSKSSFNNVFKQISGLTPSQYKKEVSNLIIQ